MKNSLLILMLSVLILSCSQKSQQTATKINLDQYEVFGDQELVKNDLPKSKEEALVVFENLNEGETKPLRFETTINSVCQKKGCWMRLDLGKNEEAFIKFKDYAFFVPKDAEGKTAIVDGTAELKITSVNKLKHYAKDAGKSKAEIDAITEPKKTYYMLATNVLLKNE